MGEDFVGGAVVLRLGAGVGRGVVARCFQHCVLPLPRVAKPAGQTWHCAEPGFAAMWSGAQARQEPLAAPCT